MTNLIPRSGVFAAILVVAGACGSSGDDAASVGPGGGNGAPGDWPAGEGPEGPWLDLPIEVLGSGAPDEPVVESRTLRLGSGIDPARVARLAVQCHRCGFYDSPELQKLDKPLTRVKASLQQHITWGILAATELGAEPTRVKTLSDWIASMYGVAVGIGRAAYVL